MHKERTTMTRIWRDADEEHKEQGPKLWRQIHLRVLMIACVYLCKRMGGWVTDLSAQLPLWSGDTQSQARDPCDDDYDIRAQGKVEVSACHLWLRDAKLCLCFTSKLIEREKSKVVYIELSQFCTNF